MVSRKEGRERERHKKSEIREPIIIKIMCVLYDILWLVPVSTRRYGFRENKIQHYVKSLMLHGFRYPGLKSWKLSIRARLRALCCVSFNQGLNLGGLIQSWCKEKVANMDTMVPSKSHTKTSNCRMKRRRKGKNKKKETKTSLKLVDVPKLHSNVICSHMIYWKD